MARSQTSRTPRSRCDGGSSTIATGEAEGEGGGICVFVYLLLLLLFCLGYLGGCVWQVHDGRRLCSPADPPQFCAAAAARKGQRVLYATDVGSFELAIQPVRRRALRHHSAALVTPVSCVLCPPCFFSYPSALSASCSCLLSSYSFTCLLPPSCYPATVTWPRNLASEMLHHVH